MIKIRIQGTEKDLQEFKTYMDKSEDFEIVSHSKILKNCNTKKYVRQFLDVRFLKECKKEK